MASPTAGLLREIWWRHRATAAAVAVSTLGGWAIHVSGDSSEPDSLTTLLAMLAFLLVYGIFTCTESNDGRGLGGYPRRLFLLPVSSLRLVAVPMLGGIVSIELLYLAWQQPMSRGESPLFVGTLMAGLMVFYQAAFWTLERFGVLRFVAAGALGIATFAIGLLPAFPPTPPPPWRSEIVLGSAVAAVAVIVFLFTWNHMHGLRSGGEAGSVTLEYLLGHLAATWPRRATAFASRDTAQFWFEWRSAGTILPALVGGVLVMFVAPLTWLQRSGDGTLWLVFATLAAPVFLAIPVGIAFSKPTFWSDDLSIPAFIAVKPVSAADMVATKVKVALASAALSWGMVLAFLVIWLSTWANLDALSPIAIVWWAFHEQSVTAVYGAAALVVLTAMILTFRFLISRLWSGLYGSRRLFVASIMVLVVAVLTALAFDASRLPRWLFDDARRLTPVMWIAALAVVAKYWLAAYTWRAVPSRHLRHYLVVWALCTMTMTALAIVAWRVLRMYVAWDAYRMQALLVLGALLAVPLARIGLAVSMMTQNRHRST